VAPRPLRPHPQVGCDSAGAGDRDLLADDGTHGQLETVDVTGDAQPRAGGYQRAEQTIGGQHLGDRVRIRVEVEQGAASRDCGSHVAQVVEIQVGTDVIAVQLE
jgi:hypothetical protein